MQISRIAFFSGMNIIRMNTTTMFGASVGLVETVFEPCVRIENLTTLWQCTVLVEILAILYCSIS